MVSDTGSTSGMQQTKIEALRLAKAIKSGTTSFLDVVETMGPALNSDKLVERVESLDILVQLLRNLAPGLLVELEVNSLLCYFIAQLTGHHPDTARIAIHGLHVMFDRYAVSPGDAVLFVERFFNEGALVDLTKEDKMALYTIFQ
ncbi:hypothetical protein BIW11_06247, partial [Tropilaelaps mercedesae]